LLVLINTVYSRFAFSMEKILNLVNEFVLCSQKYTNLIDLNI